MTAFLNKLTEEYPAFAQRIDPAESVLILTHNFPDPDALAAAAGLKHLMKSRDKKCVISFSGFIGRAENRAMIRNLGITYTPFTEVNLRNFDRVIVVDTLPQNGNISINEETPVDIILDHHAENATLPDTRPLNLCYSQAGATSTIVYHLLKIAQADIPQTIATALFYGIKTDTMDMGRNYCDDDLSAYKELFDIIDHKELSLIENPKREPQYLQVLHRGVESLNTYDNFGYTHIGKVPLPDYIPEMADLFHKLDKLEWIVCSGFYNNNLLFSIRSIDENKAGIYAHKLATIFNGSGGGHATMAAGRIPAAEMGAEHLLQKFSQAMFSIFDVDPYQKTHVLSMHADTPPVE
ncbi:MAG: DHH family phosphoesterase [Fibrobacterota bacterium]